ncbi:MBL fold metallo-hydrolase [Shewanella sp. AS16]|uniref:MBL fold metallo-hydrolase n=1 Tax=Shewanella sp. AS16 TaxID=2907625 RepID=UPI001F2AE2BD|nr:MBL fold metallo-hydrolase [Shewanella sp. AS16]MCE9687786.1 MBL fold metallo-hydrolase [Shewanella sp. AS16]
MHSVIRLFVSPPGRFLRLSILCVPLCTSLNLHAADDNFAKVEIKATQLTDTSYMFIGAGGNIGVSAGKDGILIIDDQFAPLADKIGRALAKIQPGAPRYVINTHYHGDHTGGNGHFGQQATIMAHHNVLKRLAADNKLPASALPVITYDQHISVHFNGDTLQVMYLGPGHTDGDSIVLWDDKSLVHMGDLFFKDRFPYIDLDAGGSVGGYRDNVAQVLTLLNDTTQVIPGHGGLATKADLQRFKLMLDESIAWMQQQLQAGQSLTQIKAQGIPAPWKDWGWQFVSEERWIETLYQGLK